ncbi:MAG: cystathionine gamma-synthase [Chloroflexota bacterium]
MHSQKPSFDTLAAHAGLRQRVGNTYSTVGPIVASTTFSGDSIEDIHRALEPEPDGYAYTRNANPTVTAFESSMALLEGSDGTVAFGSGMAAIHAAFMAANLAPGDCIVAASDLYGVTRSLLTQLEEHEIQSEYVDVSDLTAVEERLRSPESRVLYFESISNPLLHVADVENLVRIAHSHRATVIVDNTFATPYLFRPLAWGVDVVVHSATKYLAGHGDVVAGVVSANATWSERLRRVRTVTGAVLSPFEAWLTLRGLRTLPVRMDRHCANAAIVAQWLADQTWITAVHYPGQPHHHQRPTASRQFEDKFGGMVAFDLAANRGTTLRFLDALEVITSGTSLGDVESLVLYPPLTSHRTLDESGLAAAGIGAGLVRLSVGLESPDDLIGDLNQAAAASGLAALATVSG